MNQQIMQNSFSVGSRPGKLTVVEPMRMRKTGYIVWRCRRDCGRETVVRQSNLQFGHAKHRDCLQRD